MVGTFRRNGEDLESVAVVPGGFMPLRSDRQTLEPPIIVAGELDAALAGAHESDAGAIEHLLRGAVSVEPFREVPKQGPWMIAGLLEPHGIVLRHKQRGTMWYGAYQRADPGLTLVCPLPVPIGQPRSALLVYGPRATRDRLVALLDEMASVAFEQVRLRAVPRDAPRPTADAVVDREAFRYAIDWREP